MKNRFLKAILLLGSAGMLSACSTSIRDNPCLVWFADNGPYIVQYTAKAGADATCVANQGLDGQFDTVAAQLYPQPGQSTLALLPPEVIDAVGADGMRDPGIKLAVGQFDNGGGAVNDACTVPTLSAATSSDGSTKFEYSNLNFLEDASTQGLAFQGDVSITEGGCTAPYSFIALAWPYYLTCSTAADCIPIPNPSEGRYIGAPLPPSIQTTCNKSDAVVNALTGDPSMGVCFFAKAYPSLCPSGSNAGDANCPIQ